MGNLKNFMPLVETPQKMTDARLFRTLDELGIKYTSEEKNGALQIIVELPKEHIKKHAELMKGAVLNDSYFTKFDNESINPLIRKIKRSTNRNCTIEETPSQYIILVAKK